MWLDGTELAELVKVERARDPDHRFDTVTRPWRTILRFLDDLMDLMPMF
jgi:hypothetical protein